MANQAEHRHTEIRTSFDDGDGTAPLLEHAAEYGNLPGEGLSGFDLEFVSGTIERTKMPTFERILWRVLRGNLYMNYSGEFTITYDGNRKSLTNRNRGTIRQPDQRGRDPQGRIHHFRPRTRAPRKNPQSRRINGWDLVHYRLVAGQTSRCSSGSSRPTRRCRFRPLQHGSNSTSRAQSNCRKPRSVEGRRWPRRGNLQDSQSPKLRSRSQDSGSRGMVPVP
jgi:hypothetical protein